MTQLAYAAVAFAMLQEEDRYALGEHFCRLFPSAPPRYFDRQSPSITQPAGRAGCLRKSGKSNALAFLRRAVGDLGHGLDFFIVEFVGELALADFLQRDIGEIHPRIGLRERAMPLDELADTPSDHVDQATRGRECVAALAPDN